MKFSEGVGRVRSKNQLDFAGDLDSSVDTRSFSRIVHHYEISIGAATC